MAIKGNKGEWSEIYVLFKLLGEGRLYAGDANMNKLDLYYPIVNIIRDESRRFEYKPKDGRIIVITADGDDLTHVAMSTFLEQSEKLLKNIKDGGKSAFIVPEAESFMHTIGCEKLKAPSKDKADITIVIHDHRIGMNPKLGFSIKSQLGSPSTLLNPSYATNITYRVEGGMLRQADIERVNAMNGLLPRMKELRKLGLRLVFDAIDSEIFRNNLLFIDMGLPQLVAECLADVSLNGGSPRLSNAVGRAAQRNQFGYSGGNVMSFYEHKIKSLLLSAALGMTSAKEWTGHYDANGGYIVVRTDGEIVCYHFYNVNDVEDYLFHNTHFECSSRSRYRWGELYTGNDGAVRIKLNLQIRFNK